MADKSVWQSDEWQKARKRLLAEKCLQCGFTDKLSLVHLWRPPNYLKLKIQVEEKMIEQLINSEKIEPFDSTVAGSDTQRNTCPECNSINLRRRKTKFPIYRCGRCHHEFDTPDKIVVRNDYTYNQLYRSWKESILQSYQLQIEQEVKQLQNYYNHDYRSGKGTTTMCGKCAFLWTQKQMRLCQQCRENYHKQRYNTCYECYQQDHFVICEKCEENRIKPQPGGINICTSCYDKMWDSLTK